MQSLTLLLAIADGKFYSSDVLARNFCMPKAAVRQALVELKDLGLSIEGRPGKGYRLLEKLVLLSKTEIQNRLPAHILKQLPKLEILFRVSSTNAYLLSQLATKTIHRHVVLAEYQYDGQGQRGRQWLSPLSGGLYCSIGWQFKLMAASPMLLSLYASVAAVQALRQNGINAVLKWPNDIFINDKKLGGVLVDVRGELTQQFNAVIGIGINYNIPPAVATKVMQPITDICSHTQHDLSRNQLAAALIAAVFQCLVQLQSGKTEKLLKLRQQYDGYIGQRVSLMTADNVVAGTVVGIDSQGALILNVNGNLQYHHAGQLMRLRQ